MVEKKRCPECDAELGEGEGAESLCPACLIKLALSNVPEPEESIEGYRLVRLLGEGGMGEVWEAEQTEPLQRKVAIKLIKIGMDTRQVIARFESERQALAIMEHPCVATVFDAGVTSTGRPFFVMEYVEGDSISSYCDRQNLNTRQRLELFRKVCAGVQHAHQKGIIHRDIKPSNILVTVQDGEATPKIIDFGIAKATRKQLTEKAAFTELGQLIGTPEYMSPEQAESSRTDVDTRTDIYSLGMVLYELLAGCLPFEPTELREAGFEEILRRIREEIPSKPSTRVSTLGEGSTEPARNRRTDPRGLIRQLRGDLDWIVMRALEKERDRRYGTALGLADDIGRYLDNEPVKAGPPSLGYRARKFLSRHRVGAVVVLAILALIIGFAIRERMASVRIATERDTAEQLYDFLVEVFKASDPGRARGEEYTARELLDRGSEKVRRDLSDQPVIQAKMMLTLGEIYRQLGLYEQAQTLIGDGLEIRRAELGERDPDTLESMNAMATILGSQGKYEEAMEYCEEALEGSRAVLGDRDRSTLRLIKNMCALGVAHGQHQQAEPYCREALEGYRQAFGEDHQGTLSGIENMGKVLRLQGKLAESETYFREALEHRRRIQGEDHPQTLHTMKNVGIVLMEQGKTDEALPVYEESLAVSRRVLGEEHPDTLIVLTYIGNLLSTVGRNDDAEPYFREAVEGLRKNPGSDHPSTIGAISGLGGLLMDQGKLDEAEIYLLEGLSGSRRLFGDEHPYTLFYLNRIGQLRQAQGDLREAEKLLLKALADRRRVLGEEHTSTLWSLFSVGNLRREQGRREEAEKYYLDAIQGLRRVAGEEHPDLKEMMETATEFYEEWGKPERASALVSGD